MLAHRGATKALLVAAGICLAGAALAAAAKPVSVKWPGGQVTVDGRIEFKARDKKVFLNFTKNVRATAKSEGQSIELHHADAATAEVDSRWQFDTIKANGAVRFTVTRKNGEAVEKTSGKCDRVTVYNPAGKTLTGDQRFLVADLAGNVLLTMPAPKEAGPTAEPMTLEGDHGQVWLTAQGVEGTIAAE